MMVGKFVTLAACAVAMAIILAASEASARSAAAGRGGVVSSRPMFRPIAPHAFRNHRGFFPGVGGDYYGPDGTPTNEVTLPAHTSSDIRYTYTYDVPWDWAHRFPPNVVPSDRPYVPDCTAEAVTVPGRAGGQQTVNVTRCY
jgi:hypothetical protein